jgi:hypothetical protein
MLTYVLEFCDVDLHFTKDEIRQFLHDLEIRSVPYEVIDEGITFRVAIHQIDQESSFSFKPIGEGYKLRCKQIQFSDQTMAEIFQDTLAKVKGHAIMKMIGPEAVVVHHIQFGEAIRIIEITGNQKKVLLDRGDRVTIEQVIEAFKLRDVEERLPQLRKEIDDELSYLSQMLSLGNKFEIEQSKKRLKELQREMLLLEM